MKSVPRVVVVVGVVAAEGEAVVVVAAVAAGIEPLSGRHLGENWGGDAVGQSHPMGRGTATRDSTSGYVFGLPQGTWDQLFPGSHFQHFRLLTFLSTATAPAYPSGMLKP